MPNTNNYHLYVSLSETVTTRSAVANTPQTAQTTGGGQYARDISAVKGLFSFSFAKGTAEKLLTYEIGQVGARTGRIEYSQRLQQTYNALDQSATFIAQEGALIASGHYIAAAVNATVRGINLGIEISQGYQTANTQRTIERDKIDREYIRMGTQGRRYRND